MAAGLIYFSQLQKTPTIIPPLSPLHPFLLHPTQIVHFYLNNLHRGNTFNQGQGSKGRAVFLQLPIALLLATFQTQQHLIQSKNYYHLRVYISITGSTSEGFLAYILAKFQLALTFGYIAIYFQLICLAICFCLNAFFFFC